MAPVVSPSGVSGAAHHPIGPGSSTTALWQMWSSLLMWQYNTFVYGTLAQLWKDRIGSKYMAAILETPVEDTNKFVKRVYADKTVFR